MDDDKPDARLEAASREYGCAWNVDLEDEMACMARALAAADAVALPRVRDKTSGAIYTVLGKAVAKVDAQYGIDLTKRDWRRSRLIHEGHVFVVYRDEDGTLYARPADEFEDGRFEDIAPPSTQGDQL